jgi:hypothetical protein
VNEQPSVSPTTDSRNRSPEYIEVADKLPREPGRCSVSGCNEKLVGFCAGDVDSIHTSANHEKAVGVMLQWFRFGCPEHDVYVLEMLSEGDGLCALRHPSDPIWGWAPVAWREPLVACGWGIEDDGLNFPRLRFGERNGRVWVTDYHCLFALPVGYTLKEAEEGYGLKSTSMGRDTTESTRAQFRLDAVQTQLLVDDPKGALGKASVEALPVPGGPFSTIEAVNPGSGHEIRTSFIHETRVPSALVTLARAFYPTITWRAAHDLGMPVVGVVSGEPVALIMPVKPSKTAG